ASGRDDEVGPVPPARDGNEMRPPRDIRAGQPHIVLLLQRRESVGLARRGVPQIRTSLRGWVDVVAPALASGREVSSALETIALQRQLPTVLAAETVNEGGRRAHHAYAVDPLFQQAGGECLRRLACGLCRAGVFTVGPGEDGQLRVRREDKRLACRQLGVVKAFVCAGRGAAQAVVLGIARLHDDARST